MKKQITFLIFLLALTFPLKKYLQGYSQANAPIPPMKPGEFAGTLVLGSMRALAVDLLWLRAERLKQEGKFFQQLTLLDLLAKLQPHLPIVWVSNGYTLSYDISQCHREGEKQWKWIRQGILLLKQGLEKNPKNPHIEKQLAFIFWHRLSQNPFGRWITNPLKETYFRTKFEEDRELNPEKTHAYHHAIHWAYLAIQHFSEEDPIADAILIDCITGMIRWEKKRKNFPEIPRLIDLALSQEKRIAEKNPLFYRSYLGKFCFIHLEKAWILASGGKKEEALREVKGVLEKSPHYTRALELKNYLERP